MATSSIFYQTICGLFCIVHGCDTSGILSRNRGEFASHFAMRYRLVRTLIVHLPLVICLRACKMTAFSNCSDTCTLHATYVQYKFFWWVSLGYSKTRCLKWNIIQSKYCRRKMSQAGPVFSPAGPTKTGWASLIWPEWQWPVQAWPGRKMDQCRPLIPSPNLTLISNPNSLTLILTLALGFWSYGSWVDLRLAAIKST